jgi:hypothetical protein
MLRGFERRRGNHSPIIFLGKIYCQMPTYLAVRGILVITLTTLQMATKLFMEDTKD